MNDHDQDEGGEPLTAEAFTELLYRQAASDNAFDAIEGPLAGRRPSSWRIRSTGRRCW